MKKLLIVTYYWPPAGGPGVQRWLKFVKYLPDFGINPIVYTPQNPTFPLIDESLIKEVNSNCTIIKKNIWEPYQIANLISKKNKENSAGFYESPKKQSFINKLSLFIRGNIFIPDARKFWIKPSVKFLKKYIIENNIKTIVTSGPPHSMHLIGLNLKKHIPDLVWIADFRDPWTNIYYYKSLKLTKSADLKHHKLEKEVLNYADKIITVTQDYKENYQKLTTKKVICLTNGFDEEDIVKNVILDTKFSIAYIGAMFKERNPTILWEILSELINEINGFNNGLLIKIVGKIDNSVNDDFLKYNLLNVIDNKGYLPHHEAVIEQHKSQVLLIVNTNNHEKKGNIPGKIFEYIGARRPIIAFGPKDSQIEKIIIEANAGKHFLFDEKKSLKAYILDLYERYKSNNLNVYSNNLEKYNRKNITEELAKLII